MKSSLADAVSLSDIQQMLEAQADSLPLLEVATDVVPGEGKETARVMFIGEAPGYHESVQRRPFVGRSGKLFRSVLENIGISPKDVYITNIVKARPPENRDPSVKEILAYKPFLDREIEIIQPSLIVTLGRFSMAKFLPDVKISQVHGRLHRVTWNETKLYTLPMYHPAAALRSTKVKDYFVADFDKIRKILDWIDQQKEVEDFSEEVKDILF